MEINKNDVIKTIEDMVKSNQDILKLLYYTNNETNPLEENPLTKEQAKEVCKKYLFSNKKVKNLDDVYRCYLTMRYGDKKYHHNNNLYFRGSTFNFWVISHDEYDYNDWIGSRAYEIERCLVEMFDCKDMNIICKDGSQIPINVQVDGSYDMSFSDLYSGIRVTMVFNDCSGKLYG